MSWFKVDDKFHSHPKVKMIPRTIRAAAVGTWTLGGTWSADHEKDGYVPEYMIDELGGSIEGAQALVDVKLWRKRRGGYQFLNWQEFNPTREQNDARRESDRVRKQEKRKGPRSASQQGVSATDSAGHSDDPTPPSRPGPDPDPTPSDDQSSVAHVTYLNARAGRTDDTLSTGGDAPVEIVSVVEQLRDVCGREVSALFAWQVVNVVMGRPHKAIVKSPTAYVLGAITRDPLGWQAFIDSDGEQVPA